MDVGPGAFGDGSLDCPEEDTSTLPGDGTLTTTFEAAMAEAGAYRCDGASDDGCDCFDLIAPCGTAVHPIVAGTVADLAPDGSWLEVLGGGLTIRYANLSGAGGEAGSVGATVGLATRLGEAGSPGTTQCGVHVERVAGATTLAAAMATAGIGARYAEPGDCTDDMHDATAEP
jgi:hypothetical protein